MSAWRNLMYLHTLGHVFESSNGCATFWLNKCSHIWTDREKCQVLIQNSNQSHSMGLSIPNQLQRTLPKIMEDNWTEISYPMAPRHPFGSQQSVDTNFKIYYMQLKVRYLLSRGVLIYSLEKHLVFSLLCNSIIIIGVKQVLACFMLAHDALLLAKLLIHKCTWVVWVMWSWNPGAEKR